MSRIGLTGFNTESGLGVLNRQMHQHLPIASWLVIPHKHYPALPLPEDARRALDLDDFLQSVDVLLCAERPVGVAVKKVKRAGKRIVCVMMQEWMPKNLNGWPAYVDLFICPTQQAFSKFGNELPCRYFPWPVDTEQFPFRQRAKCERFLFIDGRGGWRGRKGGGVIRRAKGLWPDMPLVIYTQTTDGRWPTTMGVRGPVSDPTALYSSGDVLLAPHSIDGLGLELLEAASSGLPLVATDGEPWNELPLLASIPSTSRKCRISNNRMADWYEPDAEALVTICKKLLGSSIEQKSREIRAWAEGHSWLRSSDALQKLVEGGE